jgi:hypothetical protein
MVNATRSSAEQKLRIFRKDTFENGTPVRLECVELEGQTYAVNPSRLRVARLAEEWFNDVRDPVSVIAALVNSELKPDIFTFWQRVPETEPKYRYYMERESLAVLPIKSYDHWFTSQVVRAARNKVRKSQKAGVEVREASFDDDFVKGMVEIFNESPVRQGFRFWHYGKNFETVKRDFSRFLFREDVIGAYYKGELIGFAMLANAGRYARIGMFISKMKHRDKAVNNALMAKTVAVCEKRQLPYLIYTTWRQTSLVDFKRQSGFREMKVPRYFVPLTQKGKLALRLGFHHGLKDSLPNTIKKPLKRLRKQWYDLWWGLGNSES